MKYPKMTVPKISRVGCFEQIEAYIPDKIGADSNWDKPVPPSEYNKNELKGGSKLKYPPINIPTLKSRFESLGDNETDPTPKKVFSPLDILTTLLQQNPNDVRLKAFLKDMTFLQIAKQSRELTGDEMELENRINNYVNQMVEKPLPLTFPNESSIPSKGEEPPERADPITDKEYKVIEKLKLDSPDEAIEELLDQLMKSRDTKKVLSQWKSEAKEVNFEKLDLDEIETHALDIAFEDKNAILLESLKGTKHARDVEDSYKPA
jgi:hypothetical protein